MALTYGFFNSVNGDRVYNAEQMSEMFDGLIGDGIYESVGDAMRVVQNAGMIVNVSTGRARINKQWAKLDAPYSITINPAHVTLNRYTAICLRLDISNRMVTIVAIDGQNATVPTKPTPVRNVSYYDLVLAYIYVSGSALNIKTSNIEDTRTNNKLCGFVTGLIEQVDTTTLFDQYKAACNEDIARMTAWEEQQRQAFEAWFATLTGQLTVNTKLAEYKQSYTTDGTTDTYGLPNEYSQGDIVDVYLNNIVLMDGEDYSVIGNDVVLTNAPRANNKITMRILKCVIGDPAGISTQVENTETNVVNYSIVQ